MYVPTAVQEGTSLDWTLKRAGGFLCPESPGTWVKITSMKAIFPLKNYNNVGRIVIHGAREVYGLL